MSTLLTGTSVGTQLRIRTITDQCHDPKQRIHQEQGELVSTYCMSYDIVNLTHDTTRPHHMNSTSQHIYVFGS